MNTEAFLQGYLHKEAGVGSLVKSVAKKRGSVKNVLNKHLGEDSTYADIKRYIARQPKLEYGNSRPLGSTKVKTTKQGDLKSYKDPDTGYTHTAAPPSATKTLVKALTTVPRLSGNALIDKAITIPPLSLAVATGTKYAYNKNQDRIARDEDLTAKAAEARAAGDEPRAKAYEQVRSADLAKAMLTGNVPKLLPKKHPLSFINKGLLPALKSYTTDTVSNSLAHSKSNRHPLENLYKSPLAPVTSLVAQNLPERSDAQVLERAVMSGLTPEVRREMQKTPEGRAILSQLSTIEKLPPEQREQAIQSLMQTYK
jgi:hypothetical protein